MVIPAVIHTGMSLPAQLFEILCSSPPNRFHFRSIHMVTFRISIFRLIQEIENQILFKNTPVIFLLPQGCKVLIYRISIL